MEEHRALTELKQDTSRMVLTADKGVAMVIMDKQDYTNKAHSLWQTPTPIGFSTKTLQINSKTNSCKHSKQSGGISNQKYRNCILQVLSPKVYGLLKIHKVGTPLRPIVSSRGSITYGVAKELAYIIKSLVDQSPTTSKIHNILSNKSKT